MSNEVFIEAIRQAPSDETTWLNYAEWLEKQGDPRGEVLRILSIIGLPSNLDYYPEHRTRIQELRGGSVDGNWLDVVFRLRDSLAPPASWTLSPGGGVPGSSGHEGVVYRVGFSPDGRWVISFGQDDRGVPASIRMREAGTGHEVCCFLQPVCDAAFSPDSRYLLTGSHEAGAQLWDVATGREQRRFVGHTRPVRSVAYSSDGGSAVSGSDDGTARLWDVQSGRELRRFQVSGGGVRAVALSPTGQHILAVTNTPRAVLWKVAEGEGKIAQFSLGEDDVGGEAAFFSPDGRFAFATGNGTAVYDTEAGKLLKRLEWFSGGKLCPPYSHESPDVAFSPDGRHLLVGRWECARLWDLRTGKEVRRFERGAGEGPYDVVAFSPNGRRILTGGGENVVVWDAVGGELLHRIAVTPSRASSLAFSPTGSRAIAGCQDGSIQLFNIPG